MAQSNRNVAQDAPMTKSWIVLDKTNRRLGVIYAADAGTYHAVATPSQATTQTRSLPEATTWIGYTNRTPAARVLPV